MKENRYFKRKSVIVAIIVLIMAFSMVGCAQSANPVDEDANGENVIITETGEVLEKDAPETAEAPPEASPSPQIITLKEPLVEPEVQQIVTEHDKAEEAVDPNDLQIVFLGDSILDGHRDETGIPYLVKKACNANVYNLSIGGTSASLEVGEPQGHEEWTSRSFVGISLMLAGRVSTDLINGTPALAAMQKLDVKNTDYFVVEYGVNDFFRIVPMNNMRKAGDMTTYAGALRVGVSNLQEIAPDATIILCSPTYAQFFHDGVFVGDGNVLNNGVGTLFDYKGTCEYVANEKGTLFLDAYLDIGIDGYTAEEYLEDGVHLSAAGRRVYADYLSNMILKYEETKNN